MSTGLFRTSGEYVRHILDVEMRAKSLYAASGYLGSHLFSKDTLLRFFEHDLVDEALARQAADSLWKRRAAHRRHLRSGGVRRELFELSVLSSVCRDGTVHPQCPWFRVTPKETVSALQTIRDLMAQGRGYEAAFCRESLPFFYVAGESVGVTIDVVNNHGYQKIQGLYLSGTESERVFIADHQRVWRDSDTFSEASDVDVLLNRCIDAVLVGGDTSFLA